MKPRIGDTVYYVDFREDIRPAIITKLLEDGMFAHLFVMGGESAGRQEWWVQRDSRKHPDTWHPREAEAAPRMEFSPLPGTPIETVLNQFVDAFNRAHMAYQR